MSVCRSDPTEIISRLQAHVVYRERYNRNTRYTHNWSPLKSPNATTLPSVSSPRDPALSKALPLNRFGGNGHIERVNGSHNQVETRAREDGRIRMAGRVLSGCPNSEASSEERQAQFPTTALPNQGTSPLRSRRTRAYVGPWEGGGDPVAGIWTNLTTFGVEAGSF